MNVQAGHGHKESDSGRTKICFVDGEAGRIEYRGYSLADLATRSSVEEVIFLLLFGRLPTVPQLAELCRTINAERGLPHPVQEFVAKRSQRASPLDILRTAVSMLSTFDENPKDASRGANSRRAIEIISKMPSILSGSNVLRTSSLSSFVKKRNDRFSLAASFLHALTGRTPENEALKAFSTVMILQAEHEFSPSTFAARVSASTGADVYSAFVAALSALGPSHGITSLATIRLLRGIKTKGQVKSLVRSKKASKGWLTDFGHSVYRRQDPRVPILRQLSMDLATGRNEQRLVEIAGELERMMLRERGLFANSALYAPLVYLFLGIPEELFPGVFACSRAPGWAAHILEQSLEKPLIRPRATYVGSHGLTYIPPGGK